MSQTHETRAGHGRIRGSSERAFGIVFAIVFLAIALFPLLGDWRAWERINWWSFAVAGALLAVALVAPSRLAPANRLWLRFGLLLGRIVNPLVMGFLFFVVLTPVGALRRAMGKQAVPMRPDPACPTYWTMRADSGTVGGMTNQF